MDLNAVLQSKAKRPFFLFAFLLATQFQPCLATNLEGKTLTLAIPDEAVLIDGIEEEARKMDRYAWDFLRADGGGGVSLRPLENHGLPKEQLLQLAQEQLAVEKKQSAEVGLDKGKTWSSITPVQFKNPGWKGVAYHLDSVIKLKSGDIKGTEYRLVLWGGGKAWFCCFLGDDSASAKIMKVLESAVFKTTQPGAKETRFEVQFPPQDPRSWTNALGRVFEGKLVAATVGGRYVSIERSDGRVFELIPVNTFSQKDQDYLRSLIETSTKEVPVEKKSQ